MAKFNITVFILFWFFFFDNSQWIIFIDSPIHPLIFVTIKYYVSLNIEVSNFLFPDLDSFTKRDSLFSTKTIVINKTMWLIIKLYSCWPRFLTQSFERINEDHFFLGGGSQNRILFIMMVIYINKLNFSSVRSWNIYFEQIN